MRFMVLVILTACAHAHSPTFEVKREMAQRLLAVGNTEAALALASELYAEAPEDSGVLGLRGAVYLRQGLYDVAEQDLRASIEEDDDVAETQGRLGILLDLTARGADAEAHHRRAVELEPHSVANWNNLGFSYFVRGLYSEAVEAYQAALRLQPSDARVRNNLGFAYAGMHEMPAAAREFARGGDRVTSEINLGFAYERQGNLTQAYECYLTAATIEPASERAWANLRHVAKQLGRAVPEKGTTP